MHAYDPAFPAKEPDFLTGALTKTNAQLAFDTFYDEMCARFKSSRPYKLYEENRNWPIFLELALICSARGWNPADYVRKAIDSMHKTARCLVPADLLKSINKNSYNAEDSIRVDEEYKKCVELVIQMEIDGSDESDILLSPTLPLPAWFRVLYPEKINMEVINVWGDLARKELSSSPSHIEFIKNIDSAKWDKLKKVLYFYSEPKGDAQ